MGGKSSKKSQDNEYAQLSFEDDNSIQEKKRNPFSPQKNTELESCVRRKSFTDVFEPGKEVQANSVKVLRTTSCDRISGTQEISLSFDVVPEQVQLALEKSPVLLPSPPKRDVSDAATKILYNYAGQIVSNDDVIVTLPVKTEESVDVSNFDSVRSIDAYKIDGGSVKGDSPSIGHQSVTKAGNNGHSDTRNSVDIGGVSMTCTDNIDRSGQVVSSTGGNKNVGSTEACKNGENCKSGIELNETNSPAMDESVTVNLKLAGSHHAFASDTCDRKNIGNVDFREVQKCADSCLDNTGNITAVKNNTHASLETNDDRNDGDAVPFALVESVSIGSFAHTRGLEKDESGTENVRNAICVSADNEITPVIDRNTIGDNDFEDEFIVTGLSARVIGQVSGKDANSSPKSSSNSNSHRGGEFHSSAETGIESIVPTDGKLRSGKYSSNTFEYDGSGGREIVHEGTICAKFNDVQCSRALNVEVDHENVRNVHPALEKCDCYGSGDVCYSLEEGVKDEYGIDDSYADFCFEDYGKHTSRTDEIPEDTDDDDTYADFCYKDYSKCNSKTDETQEGGDDNDGCADLYFEDYAKQNSKAAKIQEEKEEDIEEEEGDEDEEEWSWFNSCTRKRDNFADEELRGEGRADEKGEKKDKEDQQDDNDGDDGGKDNGDEMEHEQEKIRGKDYGIDDHDYISVNNVVEDDMEDEEDNEGEEAEYEEEEVEEEEEEEEEQEEEEEDDEEEEDEEEDEEVKETDEEEAYDDDDSDDYEEVQKELEEKGEEKKYVEEDDFTNWWYDGDEVYDDLYDYESELVCGQDIKGYESNTSHLRNSIIYSSHHVESNAHSSVSLTKPSWQVYDERSENLKRELFIDARARHEESFSESQFIPGDPDDASLPHMLSSDSEAYHTDAFLVKGLNTRTTKDALLNFFEVISGGQVKEITSLNEGATLVTMEFPIKDIAKMKEKCGGRTLDGSKITITPASPCTSVIVSGLSLDASHDFVKLYFESPRSGGGPVDTVHFTEKRGQAVVVFNNAKDMERVLARQIKRPHVLDGQDLIVTVFHGLFPNLDQEDIVGHVDSSPPRDRSEQYIATKQPIQTAKQTLCLAVNPDVMEFIHNSLHFNDLQDLLEKRRCDLDWKAGGKHALIQCNGDPEGNCCPSLCVDEVQAFLEKFVQWHVPIEEEIWNSLDSGSLANVCDFIGDDPPLVKISEGDSGFYLRMVSLRSDKESHEEIFQEALSHIYQLEKKQNYRTENIPNVPKERIQLLKKTNFEDKLEEEFEELIVRIDDESDEILFKGPTDEVTDAITRYCMLDAKVTDKKLQFPPYILQLLNTDTALQAIKDEMAENEADAVFVLEEDESTSRVVAAKVTGISSEQAEKAYNLIKRFTAEAVLKIEDQDLVLTTTPEWNQACDEIEKDGTVAIRRDETGRTWLGGLSRDVEFSVKKLQLFIKKRAVKISRKNFLCPSKQIKRYLREHCKSDFIAIQTKYDITILDGQDGDKFIISGRDDGLNPASHMLDRLIEGFVTKKLELSQAGLGKFFSDGKADNLVEKIEKDLKCVICIEKTMAKIRTESLASKTALFESDSTESEDDEVTEDNSASSLVKQSSASFYVTTQGHSISWRAGDIVKEQADIVVASQGACARSIRRAAGPRMRLVTPNPGEIEVSPGFQLPCTHVIHTYCAEWNGGNGETALGSIVRKSLRKSDELSANSIAFPVIGTGNLLFPKRKASRIMLDEVVSFCDNNPHSSVKDVRFVIFDQDQNLITAFQQEMSSLQLRRGSVAKSGNTVEAQTWWKKIEVVEGNLTEQRVDAIVNIIGKDMDLSRAGALSKAVARAAGGRVVRECMDLGPQPGGSVVMTSGGNLPVSNIIHLVPRSSDKQHLQACLEKCLHLAHSKGLHSIAIPAIGTGAYHMTASDSALLTFQALGNVGVVCSSFSRIKIVIFVKDMLKTFVKEHKRVVDSAEQSSLPATTTATKKSNPLRSVLAKKKSPQPVSCTSTSTFHISVTAADYETVKTALAALKEGFSEGCTTQVIHYESVSQLSDRQVHRLLQSCRKRDIELKIEPAGNRVEVRGEANNVAAIVGEIWVELNERCKKMRTHEYAKLLAGHVEWRYVLHGKTRRFSSTKNAKIEEAFRKKSPNVTVGLRGDQFQLHFRDSTGKGSLSGEKIKISRKVVGTSEAGGISLPNHWEAMPKEANGNAITVHTVKLQSQSSEFQSVVQMFTKTMNSVTVKRVERIQNPLLYQAYQLRKQKMDKDNGGNNELQLFHGTAYNNVKKINSQGFNRNFSGLAHGTRLGKGVYFARDASFSLRFTPPRTDHSRYMYLARVLVGRYCQGNPQLVVPPSRDPLRPEILYDSVVDNTRNPGSFVVFADSQCYPEYLIKF